MAVVDCTEALIVRLPKLIELGALRKRRGRFLRRERICQRYYGRVSRSQRGDILRLLRCRSLLRRVAFDEVRRGARA